MYELLMALPRGLKNEENLSDVRKMGFVPAVLYGKDIESTALKIQQADLLRILSKNVQIFEVKIGDGKKHLVNVENIQRDILKGNILHISLQRLKKGETTTVKVPVVLIGISSGETILVNDCLTLVGLPQDIPTSVEIDISALKAGDIIKSDQIKLPVGVKVVGPLLEVVRNIEDKI